MAHAVTRSLWIAESLVNGKWRPYAWLVTRAEARDVASIDRRISGVTTRVVKYVPAG